MLFVEKKTIRLKFIFSIMRSRHIIIAHLYYYRSCLKFQSPPLTFLPHISQEHIASRPPHAMHGGTSWPNFSRGRCLNFGCFSPQSHRAAIREHLSALIGLAKLWRTFEQRDWTRTLPRCQRWDVIRGILNIGAIRVHASFRAGKSEPIRNRNL